ncbi:hypothetical protein LTR36_001942 [Oleoguttula mirabilis]|uniref:Uncharacterized protein n=1 Tax=Oleoguttula mirabilis TaxID=1507867 RepID=A0AAV9JMT9_9PEZI|nr:hypothetical protein LTR36_001942 [Oleoguttula mirabilis]
MFPTQAAGQFPTHSILSSLTLAEQQTCATNPYFLSPQTILQLAKKYDAEFLVACFQATHPYKKQPLVDLLVQRVYLALEQRAAAEGKSLDEVKQEFYGVCAFNAEVARMKARTKVRMMEARRQEVADQQVRTMQADQRSAFDVCMPAAAPAPSHPAQGLPAIATVFPDVFRAQAFSGQAASMQPRLPLPLPVPVRAVSTEYTHNESNAIRKLDQASGAWLNATHSGMSVGLAQPVDMRAAPIPEPSRQQRSTTLLSTMQAPPQMSHANTTVSESASDSATAHAAPAPGITHHAPFPQPHPTEQLSALEAQVALFRPLTATPPTASPPAANPTLAPLPQPHRQSSSPHAQQTVTFYRALPGGKRLQIARQ